MTRAIPFLKAASSALLLVVAAPSTGGLRADTPAKTVAPSQTLTCTLSIAPAAHATQPAVERLPKSQLAWAFSTLPDGTKVISGPNGTIWQGRIEVGMGPANPPSATLNNPTYRLYLTPNSPTQKPFYEVVPPSGQSTPKMPNFAPILPPGQSPHYILPKTTPVNFLPPAAFDSLPAGNRECMKTILALCASFICLALCSSASAQISKAAAGTPDPAQVQHVLAFLNNWPDTCSDQLARMAQVDQFSTRVLRAAIEQYHPTVVQLSSLTPISSGVSGMPYKEYEIPGYNEGRPFRVSGALTELTIDGAEHEYIVCCLARYLFDVPDQVPIADRTYKNGFESDWFYNAPEKTLPSKAEVIDTLWPFKKDASGRLTFIWPGSYRLDNNFRQWAEIKVGNGGILMGSGPGATAEQYVAAFGYCSEHYSRRNTNSLSPQDTLAQDSLQTSRTAATQGEAPTRTNTRPAGGASRRVSPMSIDQEIAREQETRISFGFPFVESACMSSDGKYVAYVRNDHLVFVWSLHPLRLVDRYTLYDPGVPGAIPNLYRHITFLRRDRVLALLFSDGSLDLVSARDGHVIEQDTRRSNSDTVLAQFLRKPDRIARLTSDGTLLETSVSGSSEKQWRVPGGKVLGAAMSQDGSVLATEGPSGRIRIFNTRTHRLLVSGNAMLEFDCLWNKFSDNGSLFACMGGTAETLATWSTEDERFKLIKARWPIQPVAVSPNGHYIAMVELRTVELLSLSRNGQIRRLSSSAIKVVQVRGNVSCLQFARSNRTLLIGLDDGDVTLWNFSKRSHILLDAN